MNPFDISNNKYNDDTVNDIEVVIWLEKRGRRANTYMTGWNIESSILKDHLKLLKKQLGCNGSIKKKKIDGEDIVIFHLQGNWQDKLEEYLKLQGIDKSDIRRKG